MPPLISEYFNAKKKKMLTFKDIKVTESCNLIGKEHLGLQPVNHNFPRYKFYRGKQRTTMSLVLG